MDDIPNLTSTEAVILRLLISNGETYGLDLVKKSDGALNRSSIYVLLGRMGEKGFVTSRQEPVPDERVGMPRRLYSVTGLGERVLAAREMVSSFLTAGAAS